MRGKVVNTLLKKLNAIAVENPALPGTPDVNYIEGWIELKWLRAWPMRNDSLVRVEEFTTQQRVWHIRRRIAGGTSWFLLQVRREWVLIDGGIAAIVVDKTNRDELLSFAAKHWKNGIDREEFISCISQKGNGCSFTAADVTLLKSQLQNSGTCLFQNM